MPPLSRRLVPPSKSEATSSGSARALLQPVELGRHVERRADRDDDAADVQRVHPGLGALERRRRRRRRRCRESTGSPAARSCRAPRARRAASSTSVSGPTAAADGIGRRAWPRRTAAPQAPSRITTRARYLECTDLSSCWDSADGRSAAARTRPRPQASGVRSGAPGHRRPAERQPGGRPRPPGRSGDQPGGRGCPRDQRRGAIAGGRGAAGGAVQPRARLSRRGRSGRRGCLVHRFGHRSSNLQSLRPNVPPPPTTMLAGIDVLLVDLPGCRRALLHLPVHDHRGDARGRAQRRRRGGARPARPDRRRGAGQRAGHRRTARRSASSRCRCATA